MPGLSERKKNLVIDIIVTFIVFCVMTVMFAAGIFRSLDWKLFDAFMNVRRHTPVHSENVVIVSIDERSLQFFQKRGVSWQWPRDFYAHLVRYLTQCDARAIVFDMIFSDQDDDRTGFATGRENDENFGQAISESGRTYLVAEAHPDTIPENPFSPSIFLPDNTFFDQLRLEPYKFGIFPIPEISHGAKGIGLASAVSEEDGIYRRYPLVLKVHEKFIPSLAFAVGRDIVGEQAVMKKLFEPSGRSTLVDRNGKLLLNWYGIGGPNGVFTYYSFHAVIASYMQTDRGEVPIIPREAFKDKIVIVGSHFQGLLDIKPTPFSTVRYPYPGMEIHATAIENFIRNDFIRRLPSCVVVLGIAAASVIMLGAFRLFTNLRTYIAVFAAVLILETGIAYWLITQNVWMSWFEILSATTLSFAGLVISGYFRESKHKRILRKSFEQYVNNSVLEQILENPNAVDFNGRVFTATVMATDIADFTSISEKLPAREVVSRLNDYLSEVSESLIDNSGFINKYIGDAILAVFGAFGEEEHERKACIAGLRAMSIIARKIEESKAQDRVPFITRMGITTGDLTMGNIGSNRKLEFTVIGDTVNSAFRLEGINKHYNTRMLVSEFTKEGAGDGFEFRHIDTLRFKGKDTPVRVYELLGMEGEVGPDILKRRDEYEDALRFYSQGDFVRAQEIFSRLAGQDDPPSQVMKSRCDIFVVKPPGPGWSGIWTMYSK
ncbi:adenylate/guanylate cyclase domain-containing protein [bacterium]|nr:adenylate/guanylate cyclase domain-containing protein [bacterium]